MSAFRRTVHLGVRAAGRRGFASQSQAGERAWKVGAGCILGGGALLLAGHSFKKTVLPEVYAEAKSSAKPDIHLYWASGSPPCWRVMIAMEEKGISEYPNTFCKFDKKEHKSPEVLAVNPRGQMPSMKVGSTALNESMGAVDYFEMVYKDQGTTLYPEDPEFLAKVLQRKNEVSTFHKKCVDDTIFYLFEPDKTEEEVKKRAEIFHEEMKVYEDYLAEQMTGEKFVAGPDFTMADVTFFPELALFVRFGLKLDDRYPNLKDYYKRLSERPSIKKTWPPLWSEPAKNLLLSDF